MAMNSNLSVSDIKGLATDYIALKEIIGENETEEEAKTRKDLTDKKKLLQNELLDLMEKHKVELSNIIIPQVGKKVLKVTSESRPNYLTPEICTSAASLSMTNQFLTEIKNSVIQDPVSLKSKAKSSVSNKRFKKNIIEENDNHLDNNNNNNNNNNNANKNKNNEEEEEEQEQEQEENDNDNQLGRMEVVRKNNNVAIIDINANTLFNITVLALIANIRQLTEHKVKKVVVTDEPKRKSRKVITNEVDEKDLNEIIKKKALMLYQIDSQLDKIQKERKETLNPQKDKYKEIEKKLISLLQNDQVYNYCKNVEGEIRHFHLTVTEETEVRRVTVTTMPDVINKAVSEAFETSKIPKNVEYDATIPNDLMDKLKTNIQNSLKQHILLYEKQNVKTVKKLANNNGRYVQ